jgi:RNA polymerase sigma factor (TIGR02999 family)
VGEDGGWDITLLLRDWADGKPAALSEIARLLQPELRRLAAHYMGRQKPGATLQPTALINEAYLRLIQGTGTDFQSRSHFIAVAATMMRDILVDRARARSAAKRGGAHKRAVTLEEGLLSDERSSDLVALDDALRDLAKIDARKVAIVERSYFGGQTQDEIAQALGVHVNTVARDLRLAQAWLRKHMLDAGDGE